MKDLQHPTFLVWLMEQWLKNGFYHAPQENLHREIYLLFFISCYLFYFSKAEMTNLFEKTMSIY
jgi:hypothetical protein